MCYQHQDVCDSLHGKVRRGEFGECLTIERLVVVDLSLPSKMSSQHALLSELRLIFGIGSSHNQRLREEGYNSIPSLLTHPRWKEGASTLLDRWERPLNPAQVYATLLHWLPTSHPLFLHLLSLIPRARLLFLDLETLGRVGLRSSSPPWPGRLKKESESLNTSPAPSMRRSPFWNRSTKRSLRHRSF